LTPDWAYASISELCGWHPTAPLAAGKEGQGALSPKAQQAKIVSHFQIPQAPLPSGKSISIV